MNDQGTVVVGTFDDDDAAERAIEQLRDAGFHRDQIGFAGHEPSGDTMLVEEHGNSAGSGAAGGLVTGAVAGGALAWLGLAAIPAIGPFLAGGAIGSALLGAAAGGITGGVLGGLLGMGIPRHKAEYHEQQVRAGRTLVTVQTAEPAIAERIFTEAGAADIDRGTDAAQAGTATDIDRSTDAAQAGTAAPGKPAEVAPARAFPVDRGEDPALNADSIAVPEHETREANGYRDAGVPTTTTADQRRDAAPVGAGTAPDDRATRQDSAFPREEATDDEARERPIRETAPRE